MRCNPNGAAGRGTDPLRCRPGRAVVPDLKRKLPGRGVWVTARARCRRPGGEAGAFRRAPCKGDVKVPADLADMLDRLLAERSALDALVDGPQSRLVISGIRARSRPRSRRRRRRSSGRAMPARKRCRKRWRRFVAPRRGGRQHVRNRRSLHAAPNWIWHWAA